MPEKFKAGFGHVDNQRNGAGHLSNTHRVVVLCGSEGTSMTSRLWAGRHDIRRDGLGLHRSGMVRAKLRVPST